MVFKIRKAKLRRRSLRASQEFALTLKLIARYAAKFFVKIERSSVQKDHIHLLIRSSRRSLLQNFFRVLAGQIAQRFEMEGWLNVTDTPGAEGGLWLMRPFSRVVRGYRAYKIVVKYIWLNEMEVTGRIPYQKKRLRGLSSSDWAIFTHVL